MKQCSSFLFAALCFCSFLNAQNLAHPDSIFTSYFQRNAGWTAGDATLSIPLPDNKVLWLFGDSYIDNLDTSDNTLPCLFQVRNVAMLQSKSVPNQMSTLLDTTQTGLNRTLFRLSNTELPQTYFWPGHGYVDGDTVFIFLQRFHTPPGTVQINHLGTYLAKLSLPNLQIASITALPNMQGFIFGRWVFRSPSSPWAYVYGNKVNNLKLEPYVARVPANNPLGAWKYWTGSAWTADLNGAAKISDYPVSNGFSVVHRLGKFYLITQENGYAECGKGQEIYAYTGNSTPYGKFGENNAIDTLYTVPDQFQGKELKTYNAYAHPEWNQNGELLISYNVNDGSELACPRQCLNNNIGRINADTYRPKFIRLPWSVLTGENRPAPPSYSQSTTRNGVFENELSVRCYPNPAQDWLNISIAGQMNQMCQIQIRDLSGKTMHQFEQLLTEPTQEISLGVSTFPVGIYVVEARTPQSVVVQKVVLQPSKL